MKKIIALFLMITFSQPAMANFSSGKIKVTGVTCSMCSNSVNKALSSLTFVESIEVDLENAIFNLKFKEGQPVSADQIKEKVEGAGFSVGLLILDFNFEGLTIKKDLHYTYAGNTYHFIGVTDQKLNNKVSLRFVDKGMTSAKEHKKYVGLTTYKCIKTGKMEGCCNGGGIGRIYHVTI